MDLTEMEMDLTEMPETESRKQIQRQKLIDALKELGIDFQSVD